jgi:hypothetical protein
MAYREEIGKIIHAIPPQIFARLVQTRVTLCFRSSATSTHSSRLGPPGRQHSSPADLNCPSAKQIDVREAIRQLDELHELLAASSKPALRAAKRGL